MSYLLIICVIGMLILIHESGHFIAAKISGIPISRFSIGFGPKLWSRKIGDTEYRFSAFPLGGYVTPAVNDVSGFYRIPWKKRLFFTLGGPLANILSALMGIILLNILSQNITLNSIIVDPLLKLISALRQFIISIPLIFKQHENLTGIVGIISQGGQIAGLSFTKIVQFSIVLNLNLAVFNLLPLPPLDGGNIVLYILERIHPKLLKLHIPLAVTGWILLIGLMVYATILDIGRISSGILT